MGFILMRSKESMGEGIKIDNVCKEITIGIRLVRLDKNLMTDTKTAQSKVEQFVADKLLFIRVVDGISNFVDFGVDFVDFMQKDLNELYFFFKFFVGELVLKESENGVFVLIIDENAGYFLFGLIIKRRL